MRAHTTERGQSIIIIVVSVFLMVVMAALIVDGGNLYMNRRAAQTAADAAALAGAYEYCANKVTYPIDTVTEYATVQNNASAVEDLTVTSEKLEVIVSITKPTFFAKIFGQKTGTVQARAAANCFNPNGVADILPIAWSCQPPAGEPANIEGCILQSIPYSAFKNIEKTFDFDNNILDQGDGSTAQSYMDGGIDDGKMVYVVMDVENFDEAAECVEEGNGGTITCDFNGDGEYDVLGGADRGWLYLYDAPGGAALNGVMEAGLPNSVDGVYEQTWYPGKPGVENSTFIAADNHRVGEIALVPIYDAYCPGINVRNDDFTSECPPYDPSSDSYVAFEGDYDYYHIVAFKPFYVSCVAEQANSYCPGKELAGIKHQPSIEGYFVDGYVVAASTNGSFDLGAYVISLTE